MRARSSRPFCSCEGRPGKPVVISRRVQVHGQLLEEAEKRQLLALEHDEKSGGSILRMLAHEG
jgi:hypothetical protein